MDDSYSYIAAIFFIIFFIFIIYVVYKSKKEEAAEKEREQKRKEKIKCCICGKNEDGNHICLKCWERVNIIKKELPYETLNTYDTIMPFRNTLMNQIITSDNTFEKETAILKLLAVTLIIEEKYKIDKIKQTTTQFLFDLHYENKTLEEIKKEYKITPIPNKSYTTSENNHDFRNQYPKPLRCEDGHYVRSKAEREIDDFFYINQIRHVYEAEYINKSNGQKFYPDFFLPDYKLYIEYFGLTDASYIEKMHEKIRMYQADTEIRFAYLTQYDDANIKDKLREICFINGVPTL